MSPRGKKDDATTAVRESQEGQSRCLCGCGGPVSRTFKAGHDSRLLSELRGQIKKGDVLLRPDRITPEQRAFALRHDLIGEDALPSEERSGK